MKRDDYCVACGRLRPLRGGLCEACREAEAKRREREAWGTPGGGATNGGAER